MYCISVVGIVQYYHHLLFFLRSNYYYDLLFIVDHDYAQVLQSYNISCIMYIRQWELFVVGTVAESTVLYTPKNAACSIPEDDKARI